MMNVLGPKNHTNQPYFKHRISSKPRYNQTPYNNSSKFSCKKYYDHLPYYKNAYQYECPQDERQTFDYQIQSMADTKSSISKQHEDQYAHDHQTSIQLKKGIENQLPKKKVELCRNYLQTGKCSFESRCKFAHGIQELLQNEDLTDTFRTRKCKTFFDKRQCRYGGRCNFKHDNRVFSDIVNCEKKTSNKLREKILNDYPQMLTSWFSRPRILPILLDKKD